MHAVPATTLTSGADGASVATIPAYLQETYWWAYVHPEAVRLFERQWLVNLILWGNFGRLRDAALDSLGSELLGRTLQVACVYGDLTPLLRQRLTPQAQLDVLDVLPVQLQNLARKLPQDERVRLVLGDSSHMPLETASYDRALLFFLLHEQPEAVRRATLRETLRVLKPGAELVIVDYHRPQRRHPLYWPMVGILRALEPYAMDLWEHEVQTWLPEGFAPAKWESTLAFGGLYQLIRITV